VDAILELIQFAAQPDGPLEPTDQDAFAPPVFGRVLTALRNVGPEQRTDAIHRLIPSIRDAAPYAAARVALICGTVVEWGADPAVAGPAVLDRLQRVLTPQEPDPTRGRASRFLGLAAMAMLCRDEALRQAARAQPELRTALALAESWSVEAGFVGSVLRLVDDLELVVLHLPSAEGYLVRLEAVASIFHLMSLMHDTFPQWCDGDPVDPQIAAMARGELPGYERATDHARFHLFDYTGLDRHPGATLWGEATPDDIPELDGVRYVLVGPTLFGDRSWDSGFFANFHDALRSRLHVTPLPEGFEAAMARLKTGSGPQLR
jgi:hypothetical protein